MNSNRIMTWCILLEEFSPVFKHVKGEDNILADALSRLPFDDNDNLGEKQGRNDAATLQQPSFAALATAAATADFHTIDVSEAFHTFDCNHPTDVTDRFINFPHEMANPMRLEAIVQAQADDPNIQTDANPVLHAIHGHNLKCRVHNNETQIALPQAIVPDTIKWHHSVLGHAGSNCLSSSVNQHLHAPNL